MKKTHNTISKLESLLTAKQIEQARQDAQDILFSIKLSELRENQGLKQEDVKDISQSSVSKIENRKDMKISTLAKYLQSIGMELEIRAKPKNSNSQQKVVVLLGDKKRRSS